MKYAYYPGCSLSSTGAEYDVSLLKVFDRIRIDLKELKGWICCGTSAAHAVSACLSLALPLFNLALAESEKLDSLVVPCAACFSRFKTAQHEIEKDESLRKEIEGILDHPMEKKVRVVHPLEILGNGVKSRIAPQVKKDLSGLKVVCYYGCLLLRPQQVMRFDICENPQSMDRLMKAAGASVLDWSYKTDCCGASFALTRTEIVLRLVSEILQNARDVGADAVVVACPLCHANLDTRQKEVNEKFNRNFHIPVFYFTQVLGLAFGIPAEELGLRRHLVSPTSVLKKISD